ncbi:hypothetical protein [Pseudomonas baetica]|uniref:hypothetical protein n=1 Tax=Pseudomonas baetica TaxID=674054 RepID=UPI002404E667|nr:hypothetical protein [Pseudomonas baetica]MDF9778885.1 hypothetical protein [Pseudomonas baetica]
MSSTPADTVHLSFPEAPSLTASVDYMSRVLTADGYPVAASRLLQLLQDLPSKESSGMLLEHLPAALADPDLPLHPLCMLPLFLAWFPLVGNELGLSAVPGAPPTSWLPSAMTHTRSMVTEWLSYIRLVAAELKRVAAAEFGVSTSEPSSLAAATGVSVSQLETRLQFLRSGLTLADSSKELAG